MKSLLTILLLIPFYCLAQNDSSETRLVNDTLVTKSGFKISEKQMLKIGTGTMPDGDFKYIRIASSSFFQYYGNDRSAVNSANSLQSSSKGFQYKVVRIDKYGTKKHGFQYYPIINVGMTRYQVDVDNAIATGELDVPEEYRPKAKPIVVEVKQSVSVADEIAKLKKLYDDGVLTKEEFEAQKKKLLDKN
jgi:hypothetical protein